MALLGAGPVSVVGTRALATPRVKPAHVALCRDLASSVSTSPAPFLSPSFRAATASVESTPEFRAKCARIMKKELPLTTTVTMLFPGGARAGALAQRSPVDTGASGEAGEGDGPMDRDAPSAPGKKGPKGKAGAKGKGAKKGGAGGGAGGAGAGASSGGGGSGSGSGPALDASDAAVEAGDLDAAVQPLAPTGLLCGKVFIGMATAQTTGGMCGALHTAYFSSVTTPPSPNPPTTRTHTHPPSS